MKQMPEKLANQPPPVRSPYPALQALLPRLASIGVTTDDRPVFDDPSKVEEYLEENGDEDKFCVAPVWAINHTDLMSSAVVNWTYKRWVN